jgi:hypothetical protein
LLGAFALGLGGACASEDNAPVILPPQCESSSTYDATGVYNLLDWGAASDEPSLDAADAFDAIFDDLDQRDRVAAAIFVPEGTFHLRRPVTLRHDFITIGGIGHGFATGTGNGGASRIIVDAESGFVVPRRPGAPRVSSLVFRDFLLDGGSAAERRRGIAVLQDNDGVTIRDIALNAFGAAITLVAADAASITGNMILENSSCLRLEVAGIACVVANNRMGGKPDGVTAFFEGQERLVVAGNNIFPDGYANVVAKNCRHCAITGNQVQSYYTGAIHLEGSSNHNTVVGNDIRTGPGPDRPWNEGAGVARDADFGVVRIEGDDNLFAGTSMYSEGSTNHAMVVVEGEGNRLADLLLRSDNPTNRRIWVKAGTPGRENVITSCAPDDEIDVVAGVSVAIASLPPAFVAT